MDEFLLKVIHTTEWEMLVWMSVGVLGRVSVGRYLRGPWLARKAMSADLVACVSQIQWFVIPGSSVYSRKPCLRAGHGLLGLTPSSLKICKCSLLPEAFSDQTSCQTGILENTELLVAPGMPGTDSAYNADNISECSLIMRANISFLHQMRNCRRGEAQQGHRSKW